MRKSIHNLILPIIAVLLFGSININAQSKEEIKKKLIHAVTQDRNSQGREFYVAFPLNERKNFNTQTIAIYVTSSVSTTVTISNPLLGVNEKKNVAALGITEFSDNKGGFSWDYEIQDFEINLPYGFRISSPDPISVYCMNSKNTTSDGYLAIPTKFWGTDYVHNCYYDFNESYKWGSGFSVVASEDNTNVIIRLRDGANKAAGFGETYGGRQHGDVIPVTLMANEVYTIQGNGETRGQFDLSGSLITSDKPVGLISYSNRAMIPVTTVTNGRDHLIEMLPPVTAWGKEYATVEYARGKDKGDYFRVVAGADKTTFTAEWFEKGTAKRIGSWGPITLKDKGDWVEYGNVAVAAPHDYESIRGMSKWKADKPFLLGQYSYSAYYDNANLYDPFYILVTAVEQYTKQTVFQTPANYSGNEFKNNYFNIIAIGDTTDEVRNKALLESVELDKQRISDIQPSFLGNRIPGTNLYWAFVSQLPQGTHRLKADTPFGGYVYGFANVDSYGWPAATAYSNLSEIDTLPPIVSFPDGCFEWIVNNIDDPENPRNGKDGDNPKQVDVGVRELPTLLEGSFNFDAPVYLDDQGNEAEWDGSDPNYDFNYRLRVTDIYQNAKAILHVTDDVGNVTDTVINYFVSALDNQPIKFGKVTVKEDKTLNVPITSLSDDIITIEEIYLKLGEVYQIETDLSFLPFVLEPRADTTIALTYTPIDEYVDLNIDPAKQFDFDTLVVKTSCVPWEYAITGQGVQPEIVVEDYNAGLAQVGDFTLSNGTAVDDGVFILNKGTDTLWVTGLRNVALPFTLPSMPAANVNGTEVTFDQPIRVLPSKATAGEATKVKFGHDLLARYLIRFEPTSLNNVDNEILVTFVSNAGVGDAKDIQDSISRWYGSAQTSGPVIYPAVYPNTRVDATSEFEYVDVENLLPAGETDPTKGAPIRVYVSPTDLSFSSPDGNFELHPTENVIGLDNDGNVLVPDINLNELLMPKGSPNGVTTIRIPVVFTPNEVGDLTDELIVKYDDNPGDPKFLKGALSGPGFLPIIEVENKIYIQQPNINTGIFTDEDGELAIINKTTPVGSERTSLVVKSISVDGNAPQMNQFENFNVTLLDGTIIPIADFAGRTLLERTLPEGEAYQLTFDFNSDGATAGTQIGRVEVISDAGPADANGNEPNAENKYDTAFDEIYTEANPNAIDDGGYIVIKTNSEGVTVTDADFGAKSACDLETRTVRATNDASGSQAVDEEIDRIEPVNPANDVFVFDATDFQNVVIPPNGGFIDIKVNFKDPTPAGTYVAEYVAYFNSNKIDTFTVEGIVTEDVFEVSLDNGRGGYEKKPGDIFNLDVFIGESGNSSFANAAIVKMEVTLLYKQEWLSYENSVDDGNLVDWDITENQDIIIIAGENWIEHKFELTSKSGIIPNAGVLFSPKFRYLLHSIPEGQEGQKKFEINPEITRATYGERDVCISSILTPGTIKTQFCVQNYRSLADIIGTSSPEQMKAVSPNPVKNNMNLEFVVSSSSDVTIEMTNLEGELVKVLAEGRMDSGIYNTSADISDLPSGVYYLTYKYLGVNETQKVVIAK